MSADEWNTCVDPLYDSSGRADQRAQAPGGFLARDGAAALGTAFAD